MDYRKEIASLIAIEGVTEQEIYSSVCGVQDGGLGDYCLPSFRYAKQLKKSPQAIAEGLRTDVEEKKSALGLNWLQKIEATNGYLNFFLDREGFASTVLPSIYARGGIFEARPSNGKTICIDYSSINIAKPFHIGHLLTTAIGGSLYRIHRFLGYEMVGINHLGDWGTQFGKMITAYLKWGEGKDSSKLTVEELVGLYVKFHDEAERDESLNVTARDWFKKLEEGDKEALALFKNFKITTLREVKKVYTRLGIRFDSYKGESFFNKKSLQVVKQLRSQGLLSTSEGAEVVDLESENMPPCLILKSDGTTLYATRDIATAIYRKTHYNFDKCLYIVAYQQELHFRQFFKVLQKMGFEWAKNLKHVPFGMVSLEGEGSLSTRKGNVVYLRDVLETSVKKATEIIEQKNPMLSGKKKVAEAVGVGAVIFGALSNARIKDTAFSYDKALNFEGETSPYIQYTHARCCSVLKKIAKEMRLDFSSIDFSKLADPQSFAVIKLLASFDSVVEDAAEKYEPCFISKYLIDLAKSFNKFYMDNRIITDDVATSRARAYLTTCVQRTLRNGMSLILIKAPTAM